MRVPPVSDAEPILDQLDGLADEFLTRLRRGERPDVEAYAADHPALAAEIRNLFPTLAAIEQLGADIAPGAAPKQLGDFRIVCEIGRGGMGVVYEAVQLSLGRRVAIKVTSRGDWVYAERFRREAQIAARLHHTNIVPVYAIGLEGPTAYYAMQFIQGRGLNRVLDELRDRRAGTLDAPQCPIAGGDAAGYFRAVARLALQAAEAVSYAHAQGVLHRDLKPGNLLLDAAGTLWVADFGLAKATDETADLTGTGDVVGTLRYLAPERFHGACDARTDVYALGAAFYELLTLRPAYDAADRTQLLEQIARADPPRPRLVNASVPQDLETIIRTAMAPEPQLRYPTAAALADDLRRFLEDQPILARRESYLTQARRYLRRHPLRAVGASVLAISTCVAFAVALAFREQRDASRAAEVRAVAAERAGLHELARAYVNESRATRRSGQLGQSLDGLRAIRTILATVPADALTPAEYEELRTEAIACLASFDLREVAARPSRSKNLRDTAADASLRYIIQPDADGTGSTVEPFDGDGPVLQLPGPPRRPEYFPRTISADGRWVAEGRIDFRTAGLESSNVVVRDRATGKVRLELPLPFSQLSIAFLPRDRLAVVSNTMELLLYDLATGAKLATSLRRFRPGMLAASPDGERIAVSGSTGTVDVMRASDLALLAAVPVGEIIHIVCWSADGRQLALAADDGRILRADLATQTIAPFSEPHHAVLDAMAFTPDGDYLVTSGRDELTRIRTWPHGKTILEVPGQLVRVADAGHRLMVGRRGQLRTYEFADAEILRRLPERARVAVFDPLGRWLATSGDIGATLWNAGTLRPMATFPLDAVGPLAFHPAGTELATFGRFSQILRWPIRETPAETVVGPPSTFPVERWQHDGRRVLWSRDGRSFVVGDYRNQRVEVYDGTTYKLRHSFPERLLVVGLDLSRDGTRLAAVDRDGAGAFVWRVADGVRLAHIPLVTTASFSPDGRVLVVGSRSEYRFLRTDTWEPLAALRRNETDAGPAPVAFAPTGGVVALALNPQQVGLVDAANGSLLASLTHPTSATFVSLSFSPDGCQLAATQGDGTVFLWELDRLRAALREFGLDWHAPHAESRARPAPLPVRLELGDVSAMRWAHAWRNMATYDALRGFRPDAIQSLTMALLQLPPDADRARAEIHFDRAASYRMIGSTEAARRDYARAVALAPGWAEPAVRLARLFATDPAQDAHRALPLALAAVDRGSVGAPGVLGAVTYRLGRDADAIRILEAGPAATRDDDAATEQFFLALAYARGKDVEKATAAMRQAEARFAASATGGRSNPPDLARLADEARRAVDALAAASHRQK